MMFPVAEYPLYDGLSSARSDKFVERPPDATDWNQLVSEVLAIQAELAILRAIPTSDKEDGETIWNDEGVLKVSSAGGGGGG